MVYYRDSGECLRLVLGAWRAAIALNRVTGTGGGGVGLGRSTSAPKIEKGTKALNPLHTCTDMIVRGALVEMGALRYRSYGVSVSDTVVTSVTVPDNLCELVPRGPMIVGGLPRQGRGPACGPPCRAGAAPPTPQPPSTPAGREAANRSSRGQLSTIRTTLSSGQCRRPGLHRTCISETRRASRRGRSQL